MNATPRRSPLLYFALVIAMAIPIMALGFVIPPVPGTPKNIPVTDFALTFLPMTAALILIHRESGTAGVRALLARVFDWRRITRKRWLAVAFLVMPTITLSTFAVTRLMGHSTLADTAIPWQAAPILFAIVFVMAAGEELGWMGYAMPPMDSTRPTQPIAITA